MSLKEKTGVVDELHSCELWCIGHEFNVSESTIYIRYGVFKQKHA